MAGTTFNSSEQKKNVLKSGWDKIEVYGVHNPSHAVAILTGSGTSSSVNSNLIQFGCLIVDER